MKRILTLFLCLLLPLPVLAEGLRMYQETGTYPGNTRVRLYIADGPCFWGEEVIDLGLDKRVPVYAMPAVTGYRAADGKAAVSLREPFTALAWSEDDEWLLIDYTIGQADVLGAYQHRIGYIRRSDLPQGFTCGVPTVEFTRVTLRLSREGSLYDDINGLMRSVGRLEAGRYVTVLGWVNNAWAYVTAEIGNEMGYFFLPLAVLEAPEEAESAPMAEALRGSWAFAGGGEMLGDGVAFDGTDTLRILAAGDAGQVCEYSVYANALGDARYPSAPWVLEVRGAEGSLTRLGMALHTDPEDGRRILTVSSGEGEGSYLFLEDRDSVGP